MRRITVFILIAFVFGCSSHPNSPAVTSPERMRVTEDLRVGIPMHGSGFAPQTVDRLVYGCDHVTNDCIWFRLGSHFVAGTIGGLLGPQGLAIGAGANTDVYIANTGASDVLVYPKGSTALKATLVDTNEYPVDVTVANNGTVYVANISDTSGNAGDVTVFNPGSTTISRTITDPNFDKVISDAIDAGNDLVVCYDDRSGIGACDEFPGGNGPGTTIVARLGSAGGAAFDGNEDFVVSDQKGGRIDVFLPNDGNICDSITLNGSFIAFDKSQHDLFVADTAHGYINEDTYAGCSTTPNIEFEYKVGSSGELTGVAVDPGPRN